MAVILTSLPSGTLVAALQDAAINDLSLTIAASGTGTITQGALDVIFEKSVRRINRKLELLIEILAGDLTPRPDEAVLDLVILQTECLLYKRINEQAKFSPGIKRVRLEAIELEFSDVGSLRSKDLDAKHGICQELDTAMNQYKAENATSDSGDIIWAGSTRRHEVVDHDNTSTHTHFNSIPDGGSSVNNDDDIGGHNANDDCR